MKTSKPETSDINRLVSKILDKPPVEKFSHFNEKIHGITNFDVVNAEKFDVILNMEVVEHVSDPLAFLTACRQLLKLNGLMLCSTINRNPKSYLMAIIGAEHVMRWLPKGTHDWNKFITPDELFDLIKNVGLTPVDQKGFVFNPLKWSWSISDKDLSVNYVTASINS